MDLAQAFLLQISLTVLPPDFINSSAEINIEIGSHFRHFG
jgi:hypothetical protein